MVAEQGHTKQPFNRRRILQVLVGVPLFCAVFLFLPAGTVAWCRGWFFIVTFLIAETLIILYLWQTNPELFIARSHFHQGTLKWDKVLVAVMTPVALTIFPIASLDDSRYHWSEMPWWFSVLGYLLLLSGFWLATWACRVNKFAEPTVRIQHDRGQTVIDTGPYARIRHPVYTASLGVFPGIALALGSSWALIPAGVVCALLVLRTCWEDQTLQAELEGYQEYTHRVPYKLIPHVW